MVDAEITEKDEERGPGQVPKEGSTEKK